MNLERMEDLASLRGGDLEGEVSLKEEKDNDFRLGSTTSNIG